MKKLIWLTALLATVFCVQAQNITAAEYFFDTDPGAGAGTPLVIGPPGTTVNFTASVPTTALAAGFHTLAIRARDSNNVWGMFEIRTVYVSAATANASMITQAEYFIDTDPGPGAGSAMNIGASGNGVNFTAVISTTALAVGFHTLAIRTKGADGVWGLFETRPFYISTSAADAGAITAAEYFVDTDPGAGNGNSLTIGSSGNTVNFTAAIPTTSLATGFHVLAIRTKNADGAWSLFETRPFYISPTTAAMGALVGGEYFIDSDPGIGNGQPFTFATSTNNINEIVQMQIPAGTSLGNHLLVARVRDVNGIWSLFDTVRTLTVAGTLPLDFFQFNASRREAKVTTEWITEHEINTSHFDVERSVNGVSFIKIGEVAARNTAGRQTYFFEDASPQKGLNFYRLKQVDQDGGFKYSVIVKVFFGDGGMNDLKLFPQPVQAGLSVVFGGSGTNLFIQVYDAGGKLVLNEKRQNASTFTIQTAALTKGTYWIVVSDGITQQRGKFVKQ